MEASDRPVRVLVVEDDQEIAQVLQRSLRMEGYDVKLTADGAQALDDTQAFLPDLIVLDLGLPGMDGIEVARQLRRDEDDTPILMLTARDALDSRVEGLDVGADDYLVKPFARQELLARMRALLRRAATARAAAAAGRGAAAAGGRPDAEPRHPRGDARRAVDRPDPARVRAARVPDAQRAAPHLAPAAARRGVGLRPLLHHEHDRGVRLQPPPKARSRWRTKAPSYGPRRGLRPPRISGSRSAGAWPAAPRR